MLKVILLLCTIASLYAITYATKKTWKYNNDILNPINWEGNKPSSINEGVIFPKELGSVGSVYELFATELTFPIDGELEIRHGGFIEISESASKVGFRIKKLNPKRWLDPNSWNYSKNAAIPHAEMVPCTYDDVMFASDATVAVGLPEVSITVNSIQIGGVGLTSDQWYNFLETDYGIEQFFMSETGATETGIKGSQCDKSGCLCHKSSQTVDWICQDIKQEEAGCLHPIKPTGHCTEICGGLITLEYTPNFDLEDFKSNIPNYDDVDSYASKIMLKNKTVIQVVFADTQEYNQLSSKAAKNFQDRVIGDLREFKVVSAALEASGIAIPKGSAWGNAFGIILGTFVAVSIIYGLLYLNYIGPLEKYNFRVPVSELLSGRPNLFAKFENKDEGRLSVAPSMVNLESSFDNPMYGSAEDSSLDVVVLPEIKSNQTEGEHENPLYSETEYVKAEIENVDVEDANNIVDLTDHTQ